MRSAPGVLVIGLFAGCVVEVTVRDRGVTSSPPVSLPSCSEVRPPLVVGQAGGDASVYLYRLDMDTIEPALVGPLTDCPLYGDRDYILTMATDASGQPWIVAGVDPDEYATALVPIDPETATCGAALPRFSFEGEAIQVGGAAFVTPPGAAERLYVSARLGPGQNTIGIGVVDMASMAITTTYLFGETAGGPFELTVTPDGRLLAIDPKDYTVFELDPATGTLLESNPTSGLEHGGYPQSAFLAWADELWVFDPQGVDVPESHAFSVDGGTFEATDRAALTFWVMGASAVACQR